MMDIKVAAGLRGLSDAWHRDGDRIVMRVLSFASVAAVIVCILGLAPLPAPDGGHVPVEEPSERAPGGDLQVGSQSPQTRDGGRGLTGGVSTHTTVKGDTLQRIGARFGVDAATLASDNGLQAGVALSAGLALRIDNRHIVPADVAPGRITINVPQRILFYEWDGTVAALPVAIGQPGWRTPRGPFTVLTKERNPTWEVPASIREEARRAGRSLPAVVPPGPNNPLGKFWLGLSIPGVGIHGTNAPASIYRAATHGCIRLGPEDIGWLYERVVVGTAGRVIYEPILLAVVGDEIFLEVHRDIYRQQPGAPDDQVRARAEAAGVTTDIDWAAVKAATEARRGIATRVGAR